MVVVALLLAMPSVPPALGTPAMTVHVDAASSCPTPDGSATCPFPTIQQGVDAASPGDIVLVDAGTYAGNVSVHRSNLTISANGTASVSSEAGAPGVRIGSDATNVTIAGFRFDGGNGSGIEIHGNGTRVLANDFQNRTEGVDLEHASGALVLGNRFSYVQTSSRRISGFGILVRGGTSGTFIGNAFGGDLAGVELVTPYSPAVNDYIVRNNTFHRVYIGVSITRMRGVQVQQNRFDGCPQGVEAYVDNDTVVTTNTFVRVDRGVELHRSVGSAVQGNRFDGNRLAVELEATHQTAIMGNAIGNATPQQPNRGLGAIRLVGAWSSQVRNNTILAAPWPAITVSSEAYSSSIGNLLEGNHATGEIRVADANGTMVRNNTLEAGGILVGWSDHVSVTGNRLESSRFVGIHVGRGGNATIANNTIRGAHDFGIALNETVGNVVEGNRILDVPDGIRLTNASVGRLVGNVIENASRVGLNLTWGSHGNVVADNLLVNHRNVALDGRPDMPNATRSGANTWNLTPQPGTNVVGGNHLGGNAYLHPNGTGYSVDCVDANLDGLCDDGLQLGPGNVDEHPLVDRAGVLTLLERTSVSVVGLAPLDVNVSLVLRNPTRTSVTAPVGLATGLGERVRLVQLEANGTARVTFRVRYEVPGTYRLQGFGDDLGNVTVLPEQPTVTPGHGNRTAQAGASPEDLHLDKLRILPPDVALYVGHTYRIGAQVRNDGSVPAEVTVVLVGFETADAVRRVHVAPGAAAPVAWNVTLQQVNDRKPIQFVTYLANGSLARTTTLALVRVGRPMHGDPAPGLALVVVAGLVAALALDRRSR